MSNLSDLLPAGAGAKSATFTASGTLPSGQAVALQSDGTVIAITSSSTSENIPESSEVKWNGTDNAADARIAFDAGTADKFMVVWRNRSQSNYLYGVVGTISGSSVSFGTAQVISSSYSSNIGLTSTKANQFVVVRKDQGGSSYGIATVLDILSGTLISPGSNVTYSTANTSYNDVAADPNDDTKVVVSYDGTNSNGRARVGTVSGSSISFGTEVRFTSSVSSVYKPFIVFDKQTSGKFAIGFINNSTSYPYIVIGSYSGTTLTFGTETVTYSGGTSEMPIAADPFNADKYVVGRRDNSAGYLAVVTVSGTTPTIASYSTWTSPNGPEYIVLACDNATENKLVVGGTISSSSMKMHVGTISGTSITYGSEITFSSSNPYDTNSKTIAFNSAEDGNFAVAFLDSSDDDGRVKTGQMAFSSTNSADFVGITDEAIANTATGSVVVEGGVITNSSLIDFAFSNGSSSVFESASTLDIDVVHDSANDKMVICYKDGGNSNYGTAIVGTVSGESITFGSPTVFASVNAQYSKIAFDSTNNKVVINYIDGTNSDHAKAIVGTVSGTSISFGSATTYNTVAGAAYTAIVYDSGNDKFVVKCAESSAKYNVGTVSGTSISFGSQTSLAMQYDGSLVYDSVNGKVVSVYRDVGPNDYGKARVGTVSGTSISFGTDATFDSTAVDYVSAVYDTDKQKVVVAYHDVTAGDYGKGVVGTVSGTSISFGTPATFNAAGTDYIKTVYDSNINKPVVLYQDTGNSSYGTIVGATVSGTDITFSGEYVFLQATANRLSAGYDSTNNKIVTAYRDSDGSGYGTSVVISATDSLTTGSTYYVQDDGSLSTTSSSVTAGKALSSTTLLLKG